MKWVWLAAAAAVAVCAASAAGATVLYQTTVTAGSGQNIANYTPPGSAYGPAYQVDITLTGATFGQVQLHDLGYIPYLKAFQNDPNQVYRDFNQQIELGCFLPGPGACSNANSGDSLTVFATTLEAFVYAIPLDLFATAPNYAGWPSTGWTGNYTPDERSFHFLLSSMSPDASYTITISSVPEPTSWALMIAGFGLLGGALRRHRYRCELSTWLT